MNVPFIQDSGDGYSAAFQVGLRDLDLFVPIDGRGGRTRSG